VRLQRVLAEAGVAARRKAEQLILEGRVEVNGQIVRTLPAFVDPARDRIIADGRELPRLRLASAATRRDIHASDDGPSALRKVYLLLNKPERVLTAVSDPGGRSTVMDIVKYPGVQRLFPVGRLEFDARGLVLITNDGPLANLLTHARFGVPKVYEARVKGLMPPDYIADLQRGLNIKTQRNARELGKRAGELELSLGGVKRVTQGVRKGAPAPEPTIDRGNDPYDKTVLRITVRGPLHTPLDELMAAAGVKISQLIQVGLGPLGLHELRLGEWRELGRHEVGALKRLAAKADHVAGGAAATGAAGSARGGSGVKRPVGERRGGEPPVAPRRGPR